jgi:hypothetical protein
MTVYDKKQQQQQPLPLFLLLEEIYLIKIKLSTIAYFILYYIISLVKVK